MIPTLITSVSWPGIVRVHEFSYTCSHGTTPGIWSITTTPQPGDTVPQAFGDLSWGDGFRTLTLRGCKASSIDASYSGQGTTWHVRGFDRRWKWRNQYNAFGGVRGRLNRLDTRGKLVPWSIRSPQELAEFLLNEMGETDYTIDLPAGLKKADGADLDRYLRAGETFRQSNTNPYFNLDRTSPVDALNQLCDDFGRRIVFKPFSDRVTIEILGEGAELPDWPSELIAPSITDPNAPRAIALSGAPVRIQFRSLLEPVGEEFDGLFCHIDQLSYAPKGGDAQARVVSIGYGGNPIDNPVPAFSGVITWEPDGYAGFSWNGSGDAATALEAMAAALNADPSFAAKFTAAVVDGRLVITPLDPDTDYQVSGSGSWPFAGPAPAGMANLWAVEEDQPRKEPGRTWRSCPPPHFRGIGTPEATTRLSLMEVIGLAQKHVFKTFRVRNVDPATGKPPLVLPWFGKIDRLSQLTIQPTKVEQVVPIARIAGGVDKGNPVPSATPGQGAGVLPEFYNGYSRDRAATVTGSVWKYQGQVLWDVPKNGERFDHNTKPTDRVFVPFEVHVSPAGDQLITFAEPVYAWEPQGKGAGYIKYPELTLETACIVTDKEFDQVVRYEIARDLIGGTAPAEWHRHEDLALGIVGEYEDTYAVSPGNGAVQFESLNEYKGFHHADGDMDHITAAAESYLYGHARKYQKVISQQRQAPGFQDIEPDGAILQISWTAGPGNAATTTASRGSEHSPVVLPYAERRRKELMAPNKAAAAANMAENELNRRLFPRPPADPR